MHSIKYRTYYEDTDAQGVVYYANYLRFIERARTEYLREFGYQQKELLEKNVIFIVRKLSIKYLSPVYLDEIIRIESNLKKVKKLSFNFFQEIYNEDNQKVCEAEVFCGSIDAETRKPSMLPLEIQKKMIEESSWPTN